MKLYRNSSQKPHRELTDAPIMAVGVPAKYDEPSRVTIPLGYSGPLTNFTLRLTPEEALCLSEVLVVAVKIANMDNGEVN